MSEFLVLVAVAIGAVIVWRLATEKRRDAVTDPTAAEVAKIRRVITNVVLVVFGLVVVLLLFGSW